MSIDVEIMKQIRAKGLNASQIAEDAFRIALKAPTSNLKTTNPEKSLFGTWIRLPYKYRTKATNIFMEKNKGLLPNFERQKHIEQLLKIYSNIAKQTKISLKKKDENK